MASRTGCKSQKPAALSTKQALGSKL